MPRRAARLALSSLVALLLALAALTTVPTAAVAADKDCGDFASQAGAQKFYLDAGGPQQDPHQLDADGDGVACESNPCPCSEAQSSSGSGDAKAEPQPEEQPTTIRQKAKVIKVLDGDTVDVKLTRNGKRARVRLIGIDTPEVYGGTECGGPAASRAAKKMLPRGTRVLLVSDPSQDEKDRYGRLLRYVMKKSVDVNRVQVKRGHARVYVYGGKPFKRVTRYRSAQASAKKDELGFWGSC